MKQDYIKVNKLRYEHLSTGLKWAVVGGYVGLVSFAIGFIIGFVGAL